MTAVTVSAKGTEGEAEETRLIPTATVDDQTAMIPIAERVLLGAPEMKTMTMMLAASEAVADMTVESATAILTTVDASHHLVATTMSTITIADPHRLEEAMTITLPAQTTTVAAATPLDLAPPLLLAAGRPRQSQMTMSAGQSFARSCLLALRSVTWASSSKRSWEKILSKTFAS